MGQPAPDAETRERFAAWLADRDPELAAAVPAALPRLEELGGLEREGAGFARTLAESGASDEESERLLQVHAAWTRFRRRERNEAEAGIAWVGAEAGPEPSAAVEWIEAEALPAQPPTGPAPSLLAPGQRPRPVRPPKRGLLRPTDLLVPLALLLSLVAVFLPAFLERRAVQALRAESVTLLQEELSRGSRPARLQAQAALGAWLARAREVQRQAVSSTCEAGAWCRERIAELDRSRQLARELAEGARRRGAPPPEAGWRPRETTRRALLASLDPVARAAAAAAPDERLAAHYREVVAAERRALTAAGIAP